MNRDRRLRVLALAPYPETAPSTRFRVAQLRPALAEAGVDVTLHPFLPGPLYAAVLRGGPLEAAHAVVRGFETVRGVLDGAGRFDVVLVQRGIGLFLDRSFLSALVGWGTPVVYDFDDAVFLSQERGRRWLETLRKPAETTAAFCRAARVVLAGNAFLAGFARDAVGRGERERVRVLPTVVDTDRFVPAPATRAVPVLGWVGSDSTVPYLEALAPALRELARRVPYRLTVVAGSRRPHLPGVEHDFVPWRPDAEVSLVQALDVGLYPLDDSPWSRGKCGFKAIQYLACGVPCVASPVGVLEDIVLPGETGLLAGDAAAWVEACARLLGDADLRARLGGAGRDLVSARYSVRHAAPLMAEALWEAAAS